MYNIDNGPAVFIHHFLLLSLSSLFLSFKGGGQMQFGPGDGYSVLQ